MINDIVQKQNTQKQIERLAAQSYLYSAAKYAVITQTLLDTISPIVFALLIVFFQGLEPYTAFGIIIVAVFDQILERFQSSHKKEAASIQESFDCDVLSLEHGDLTTKHLPDLEAILEAAEGYKKKHGDYSKLENWYPVKVQEIPLYLARLVCQRENCWWDGQLRRRYIRWVTAVLLGLILLVTLLGLVNGLTIGKFFLAVIIPLLPTFLWAYREINRNSDAMNEKLELKRFSEEIWTNAINNRLPIEEVKKKSRHLQDHIYNNRRTNPFILDFFYWRLWPQNETQMNRKAEELVEEAKQSLPKNNP